MGRKESNQTKTNDCRISSYIKFGMLTSIFLHYGGHLQFRPFQVPLPVKVFVLLPTYWSNIKCRQAYVCKVDENFGPWSSAELIVRDIGNKDYEFLHLKVKLLTLFSVYVMCFCCCMCVFFLNKTGL